MEKRKPQEIASSTKDLNNSKPTYILDPATIRRAHNTTHVLPIIFPRNTNAKSYEGATTIAQNPRQVEKSNLSNFLPR
jgi:hypothetical protein